MSEQLTPEQEDTLNAAALDSAETLKVSVETIEESELDASAFEFSLNEITESLKIPVRVFTFDNPVNPDKPFKFAMRQLTSKEHGEIYQSVFDANVLKGALSSSVGNGQVDTDAALDSLIDNMAEGTDFQERSHQQNIAAVFKCMVLPKNKNINKIKALPRGMITTLAEGCREEIDRSWTFQSG